MVNVNKNITKVCSFYASDWHFITMLLPHINAKIDEKSKITTILEEDAQDKVEILLGKLKLNNTERILNIGWKNKELNKENLEKVIEKSLETENLEIIISGSKEYIKEVNTIIEKSVELHNIENEIRIINCYSVEDNLNIKEILEKHEIVLNTAGEKSSKEFMKSIM